MMPMFDTNGQPIYNPYFAAQGNSYKYSAYRLPAAWILSPTDDGSHVSSTTSKPLPAALVRSWTYYVDGRKLSKRI